MLCFVTGLILLFFGIKDSYQLDQTSKKYLSTQGNFDHYDVYDSDKKQITYRLTYCYSVENKEYTISTDYGTTYIPNENSTRMIKYSPQNPAQAILVDTNSNNGLLFMGGFFTLVSFTFILIALSMFGYFDRFNIDIVGCYIGLVFYYFKTVQHFLC